MNHSELGRPVEILLVEDNPMNQLVLKTLLHQVGVEPVVVGKEVVRELDEEAAAGRSVATAEERRVAFDNGPGSGPITGHQPSGQFPVP